MKTEPPPRIHADYSRIRPVPGDDRRPSGSFGREIATRMILGMKAALMRRDCGPNGILKGWISGAPVCLDDRTPASGTPRTGPDVPDLPYVTADHLERNGSPGSTHTSEPTHHHQSLPRERPALAKHRPPTGRCSGIDLDRKM